MRSIQLINPVANAITNPVPPASGNVSADPSVPDANPTPLHHSPLAPAVKAFPGLAADANLDNYLADLEDLSAQINRYLERVEFAASPTEPELLPLLQRVTKSIKNIAVIYTDCLDEAIAQFGATQQQVQSRLSQFPEAIADLQRRLLRTDQQLRQLGESVAIYSAAIDRQIAFDNNLKNDAQRRARRTELLESDGDYIAASIALKEAQDRRENLLIELQLLRNQFSVLKLGVREAIAVKELAAFDAA